jgi:hypothetical protein
MKEFRHATLLPYNAYLSASSGDAWTCERGYRKGKSECAVPANGYLTESNHGSGWTCDRGFRPTHDECLAIKVPTGTSATPLLI